MCSDFCICPGLPTNEHVKAYGKIPEAELNKYGRTNVGFNGNIDLARFTDPDTLKPLFWTYDPTTQKEKADLKSLSSNSMVECLDNIEKIG